MRSQTLQLPPLRSVLKSGDVEDPVNRYVHRTLAYLFVKAIFRTRITPNMITLSTVIIGFSAGCAFIWGTPTAMFVGGVGIWVAAILDGADGILARAKNLHSEFGRALDGSADSIVAVFTVFPGFYHIWVTYHNPYHLALMVRPGLAKVPKAAMPTRSGRSSKHLSTRGPSFASRWSTSSCPTSSGKGPSSVGSIPKPGN
jgi:hypothetical protein